MGRVSKGVEGMIAGVLAFLFASAASPVLAVDRSADLTAFRETFFNADKSYAASARAEAGAMLTTLESEAAGLSDAAFELRLAEIVAKADNGHTLFFTGLWQAKFNRADIKFLILNRKLYIGAAGDPLADLIGAEITRIGGQTWPDMRRALSKYQGGLDAWKEQFIHHFLESPEILHAAGLIESPDALMISGTRREGEAFEVTLTPQTGLPALEGREAFIPPARIVEIIREDEGTPEDDRPLYLRDHAALYRFEWLMNGTAYIQFKANAGESRGINADDFGDNVIGELEGRRPANVVLDQRFNSGGDLNNTRRLMQALPGLVAEGGKVYVITSGKTFSAGISSIGYLKQAGGDKVVIVGGPIGDRLEFWAEGGVTRLPQSGAMILYATERHNYMTGCPEPDCHGSIQRHPISVETLDPDDFVPLTYADFAVGRDPALEKIQELMHLE